jgi:hypothetical protein
VCGRAGDLAGGRSSAGVPLRQARHLGRARCRDGAVHRPSWPGSRDGLGPHPSSPDHSLRVDRPHQSTSRPRGHVDTSAGRPPARWPRSAPRGCGRRPPVRRARASICAGRRSCADSTWNTLSDGQADARLDPSAPPHPAAADRWIWLVIAAHTQLRLPRPLAEGLRRPWEKPADPNPARAGPSRVQEPPHQLALPGPCTETQPARPRQAAGSKNLRPAIRYDVGKTTRRPGTIAERDQVRP